MQITVFATYGSAASCHKGWRGGRASRMLVAAEVQAWR